LLEFGRDGGRLITLSPAIRFARGSATMIINPQELFRLFRTVKNTPKKRRLMGQSPRI
jgi:hypothetical protein